MHAQMHRWQCVEARRNVAWLDTSTNRLRIAVFYAFVSAWHARKLTPDLTCYSVPGIFFGGGYDICVPYYTFFFILLEIRVKQAQAPYTFVPLFGLLVFFLGVFFHARVAGHPGGLRSGYPRIPLALVLQFDSHRCDI